MSMCGELENLEYELKKAQEVVEQLEKRVALLKALIDQKEY